MLSHNDSQSGQSSQANLAVFVSGRGSNMQAIHQSCESGVLHGLARVTLVVSNKSTAPALDYARSHGIDTAIHSRDIGLPATLSALRKHRIDFIALAGYLKLVEPEMVREYRGRILNIHPSLAPKFTGKGMYGSRVHQAALDAGETESGATVHIVDEEYDSGEILAQESVPIKTDDTADSLGARVLRVEHTLYPATIAKLIRKLGKKYV